MSRQEFWQRCARMALHESRSFADVRMTVIVYGVMSLVFGSIFYRLLGGADIRQQWLEYLTFVGLGGMVSFCLVFAVFLADAPYRILRQESADLEQFRLNAAPKMEFFFDPRSNQHVAELNGWQFR